MKKRLSLLLLLASTVPCFSQESTKEQPSIDTREPAEKRKQKAFDRKVWFASAIIVGTSVFDVETTARCTTNPACGGTEMNSWLYGRRPSRVRMYTIRIPVATFAIWRTWRMRKDDLKAMRMYEDRNKRFAPEGRLWEKPIETWYVPMAVLGGFSSAAGFYHLATYRENAAQLTKTQPGKTRQLP